MTASGALSRLLLATVCLGVTGCVGTSVTVVGDTPVAPPLSVPPPPQVVLAVVDETGAPAPGVEVRFDRGDPVLTGPEGTVAADWLGRPIDIELSGPGYHPEVGTIPEFSADPVRVGVDTVVAEGRVVDPQGQAVPLARIALGDSEAVSGPDGSFTLRRAVSGEMVVTRPAWETATVAWDGGEGPVEVTLEPVEARALHISGPAAGDPDAWEGFLDLADRTEINALVVDLKDESGRIFYASEVEVGITAGAVRPTFDIDEVVADARDRDIYLIGRVVSFQDPVAAVIHPDLAIWDTTTDAPYRNGAQYFLDPTDPAARGYALDLAEEACRAGFDELQFDYVRYPDGFPAHARFDGGSSEPERVATIAGFLAQAQSRLHPLGCAVAADVFGFIVSIPGDGGIGQHVEELSGGVDVLSPMIYPSHYSSGWFGFECPNANPGPVVANALDDGLPRLQDGTYLRPWVQDFSLGCGGSYGTPEVRAQIEAAAERNLGWMLWNSASRFTIDALAPAE